MAAGRPAAFACRQGDRPQPPELALPGEDAAGARSRPPSLDKLVLNVAKRSHWITFGERRYLLTAMPRCASYVQISSARKAKMKNGIRHC